MKNSTQKKIKNTIPKNIPQKIHIPKHPYISTKNNASSTLPWQFKRTLRCAPPGNERSCIRYLGNSSQRNHHSSMPGTLNIQLKKMVGNQLDDEPNLHMKNDLHENWTIPSLDMKMPPEVWCFRYVFGVQIPSQVLRLDVWGMFVVFWICEVSVRYTSRPAQAFNMVYVGFHMAYVRCVSIYNRFICHYLYASFKTWQQYWKRFFGEMQIRKRKPVM